MKNILFSGILLLFTLILSEGAVRLANLPMLDDEPYYFGFSGRPDYFIKIKTKNGPGIYQTNPDKDIHQTRFHIEKTDDAFRVFTLGGSVTYGEPFGNEVSFSRLLEDRLRIQDTCRHFQVINCGRKGFGSVRVRTIFDEIIRYQPDCIVIYFGNNEKRDDYFHRQEINIEVKPTLKKMKHFLDYSRMFRMVFHLLIKKKITSYGAENLKTLTASDAHDPCLFTGRLNRVNEIRDILDNNHGGRWQSHLDSAALHPAMLQDSSLWPIQHDNIWHPNLKNHYASVIKHMIRTGQSRHIPILFVSRAKNFYYNRDARLLFERFNQGNLMLRDLCLKEGMPLSEFVPALNRHFGDEIGYNAFMDEIHLSLRGNQILAEVIFDKLLELRLIPEAAPLKQQMLRDKMTSLENEKLAAFAWNSLSLSMLGWQTLICMPGSEDQEKSVKKIESLARQALALNQDNTETYFLLGALYTSLNRHEAAEEIWLTMKTRFE